MEVENLIGRTIRQAPKDVDELPQQLLLRSGHFYITGEYVITYEGGHRIISKTIEWFIKNLKAEQRINYSNAYFEMLQVEFPTYRFLPRRFHALREKISEGFRPLGLLYPKRQPLLEIHCINETIKGTDRLFSELGLECILAESLDGKTIILPMGRGRDRILSCDCGYTAMEDAAVVGHMSMKETARPLEEIETPNCKTIEEVASFVGVPKTKTAKAVFYSTKLDGKPMLLFCVIRGDLDINETKVRKKLKIESMRPATDEEILNIGAQPGYASPIGVDRSKCIVLVDRSIEDATNLVAGANREGYHYLNCNYPRDFTADVLADFTLAEAGHPCPHCGKALQSQNGVVIATLESRNTAATFLNKDGKTEPLQVNVLSISLLTLLAAIIQRSHDKYGIILPRNISPWHLMILNLSKKTTGEEITRSIIQVCNHLGIESLVDSRKLKPGQKFMEADLQGIPIRLVISDKNEGKIEVKERDKGITKLLSLDEVSALLKNLQQELKTF